MNMSDSIINLKEVFLELLQKDSDIQCAVKELVRSYETGYIDTSLYEKKLQEKEKELEEEKIRNQQLLAGNEELGEKINQYEKQKKIQIAL